MRTSVQIISSSAAIAQQGRGTRVVFVEEGSGPLPNRTQVEIQGIEEAIPNELPGGAIDPLKTRVKILNRIEPEPNALRLVEATPATPIDPREQLQQAIANERHILEELEKVGGAALQRLRNFEDDLIELDDREADREQAAAREAEEQEAAAEALRATESAAAEAAARQAAEDAEAAAAARKAADKAKPSKPGRKRPRKSESGD